MEVSKNSKGPINVYTKTLSDVREYVKGIPGMTITRFYDEAAKEKLKLVKNDQITGSTIGGQDHSETH